ncbi:hypothetical protein BGW38_005352 [Lunasporangiospora selenospora]|uniref:Uncharacterized protein n=1 Tax=Lunasporangiospora selenospora TaxID=979761 RepID=A0A9P6FN36_9FUNG|nr:hypothetical protein BGW38_005352 [Lunasporangiospora selenospora]
MQWKLRIRSQSIAKRWSHIGTGSGPTINPAPTVVTTAASLPASRNNTVIPMDLQDVEEEWAFTQDLQPDQEYMRIDFHNPMRSAPRRPAGEMTEQPVQLGQSEQSEQPEQPEQPEQRSGAEAPPVAVPRRVADVYSALHNSTSHQSQQQQQQQQQQQPPNDRVEPQSSRWEPLKDLMRDLSCCTCFFREARVWMIEISIRDGMIDEYALPVPSPIYCDYRLPGYDDVVASQAGISLTAASASLAVPGNGNGSAAMTTAPRYSVPPPAYESDSENESEDGEDDEDVDDEDEDDENRAVDSPHSNRASAIANRSHPTEAQSRSIEMTSVVISRPDSSNTSASMTSVGMTNTGFPRVGSEQSMATMTTLIEPTFTSSSAPPSASSPAPVSTRPDMGGEAGLTETDKS